MPTSAAEFSRPRATNVTVTNDTVTVNLSDGRVITVPTRLYPRLIHATAKERVSWRLIGGGCGIQWPDVEEDLSIDSLIAGRGSMESAASLDRWLATRRN